MQIAEQCPVVGRVRLAGVGPADDLARGPLQRGRVEVLEFQRQIQVGQGEDQDGVDERQREGAFGSAPAPCPHPAFEPGNDAELQPGDQVGGEAAVQQEERPGTEPESGAGQAGYHQLRGMPAQPLDRRQGAGDPAGGSTGGSRADLDEGRLGHPVPLHAARVWAANDEEIHGQEGAGQKQ